MATFTKNLKLKKPEVTDYYNIEDFNENSDILDTVFDNTVIKIETTDWSSATTTVNDTAYYICEKAVRSIIGTPSVSLSPSNLVATSDEEVAFGKIKGVTVDDTKKILKLYASEKPATSFSIIVKGVG